MPGGRADNAEYTERVNAAADLLAEGTPATDVAAALAARLGVSTRQARRYVDRATAAGRQPVPEDSVVFTVKLPASLATRVRRHARDTGVTISALVTQALTAHLDTRRRPGLRG
ncbi:MAG TPA: ribbon-helix-helix protein, CopG family [Pseudonocardiaceae bacterium]|nr:ribbon-helix-helix protein, CopG family [Pseudonocardiaceae bacterium]